MSGRGHMPAPHGVTTKRLLVTGSGSGIGRATVRLAVARGWRVAALDRRPPTADADADPDGVLPVTADVTDETAVATAFSQIQAAWGMPPNAVVHAAGIYPTAPTTTLAVGDWDHVLTVNAKGSFLIAREAARRAAPTAAGTQDLSIVLLTSIAYERGDQDEPAAHYNASKGAIVSLVRQLAVEWGPTGVRVNAVSPGVIRTPMLRLSGDPDRMRRYLHARVPLRRLGRADEVASACIYLAGDDASYITGAVLPVDGGARTT